MSVPSIWDPLMSTPSLPCSGMFPETHRIWSSTTHRTAYPTLFSDRMILKDCPPFLTPISASSVLCILVLSPHLLLRLLFPILFHGNRGCEEKDILSGFPIPSHGKCRAGPGGCGSGGCASSQAPKGCQFNSWASLMPGLRLLPR